MNDSTRPDPPPRSREAASRHVHEVVYRLLRARLNGGDVLDIPCGSGAFTRRLVEGGYRVVAADIACHAAVPKVEFAAANMDGPLPFGNGRFDAIVCIEGIEHIRRPFDFVSECRRILKPGAWLFLTTPNISSLRSRWRWFLTGFHNKAKYPLDESAPSPRHHVNMLSFPQLRYLLHTSGFTIETVTTNRVKAASWLYLPWAPVQYVVSRVVLPKGARSPEHGRIIRETARQMARFPVLFGETLIVAARVR